MATAMRTTATSWHQEGGVLWLTLDRPKRYNACNGAMFTEVADGLELAARDDSVCLVVLTGAPNKGGYFSSGADLGDSPQHEQTVRFFEVGSRFPKPIVAAVNGHAVGVGCTWLPHCDAVYCTPAATFWTPFTRAGLVPEFGSSILFPRLMGRARATELLVFGEKKDARWAREAGLVSAVVPGGRAELLSFVRAKVKAAIATAQPLARKSFVMYKEMLGPGAHGSQGPTKRTLEETIAMENSLLVKRSSEGDPMTMIQALFKAKAEEKARRAEAAESRSRARL